MVGGRDANQHSVCVDFLSLFGDSRINLASFHSFEAAAAFISSFSLFLLVVCEGNPPSLSLSRPASKWAEGLWKLIPISLPHFVDDDVPAPLHGPQHTHARTLNKPKAVSPLFSIVLHRVVAVCLTPLLQKVAAAAGCCCLAADATTTASRSAFGTHLMERYARKRERATMNGRERERRKPGDMRIVNSRSAGLIKTDASYVALSSSE